MGSQFPPHIQQLLWKLHWCREETVARGFDTAGLLIREAIQEIEDIARSRQAIADQPRPTIAPDPDPEATSNRPPRYGDGPAESNDAGGLKPG